MTPPESTAHELLDEPEFARRVIEPRDFVADTEAFVDVRIERSKGKASYSFIGPGVSQNADQAINLQVPHGFNVGAASMPSGVINNPHLHYTSEVFVCTRGKWLMTIGRHSEQSLVIEAGDVFVAPTWVFRGFENLGDDDGWVFVVLGRDDTGGIIWSPDILREAADTGLYLAPDSSLIDTDNGGSSHGAIVPVGEHEMAHVDSYTDAELEAHVVRFDALDWSHRALLSNVARAEEATGSPTDVQLAPVFGFGMTEDRKHRAPVMLPQGFSLEWIKVPAGSSVGLHRHGHSQALLLSSGAWEIQVNRDDPLRRRPATGSVISVPPGVWRDFRNVGADDAIAMVICGTDSPTHIEWDAEIVAAARTAGYSRDASGHLAPLSMLSGEATPQALKSAIQPSNTDSNPSNPGSNSNNQEGKAQ